MAISSRQAAQTATGPAAANVARRQGQSQCQAIELASWIFSQRNRLGRAWRQWAENEVRKRPDVEQAARAELNRLLQEARRERS